VQSRAVAEAVHQARGCSTQCFVTSLQYNPAATAQVSWHSYIDCTIGSHTSKAAMPLLRRCTQVKKRLLRQVLTERSLRSEMEAEVCVVEWGGGGLCAFYNTWHHLHGR
jgi:hypothetical protein